MTPLPCVPVNKRLMFPLLMLLLTASQGVPLQPVQISFEDHTEISSQAGIQSFFTFTKNIDESENIIYVLDIWLYLTVHLQLNSTLVIVFSVQAVENANFGYSSMEHPQVAESTLLADENDTTSYSSSQNTIVKLFTSISSDQTVNLTQHVEFDFPSELSQTPQFTIVSTTTSGSDMHTLYQILLEDDLVQTSYREDGTIHFESLLMSLTLLILIRNLRYCK